MFRWKLDIGSGYELVNPIYGKDVSLDKEMESGEWFYRETLNGTLTFTCEDWYIIQSSPLDTDFNLRLEKKDISGTYKTFWSGIFYRTDGGFDDKNRTVKIKPKTNDRYKKLLAAKDKEYDIIALGPKAQSLTYIKRTVYQIYYFGSAFVTNIIGKNSYDISISPPTYDDLIAWGFDTGKAINRIIGNLDLCQYYNPTPGVSPFSPDYENISDDGEFEINFAGMYYYFRMPEGTLNQNADFKSVWSFGGKQYTFWAKEGDMCYFTINEPVQGEFKLTPQTGSLTHVSGAVNTSSQPFTFCADIFTVNPNIATGTPVITFITKTADNSVYFIGEANKGLGGISGSSFRSRDLLEEDAVYVKYFGGTFFGRCLSDLSGTELLDNDFSKGSGYKYSNPFSMISYYCENAHTTDVNIYGKFTEDAYFYAGEYFDDYIVSGRQTIPLSKKDWLECSYWGIFPIPQPSYDKAIVLKDAYKLGDFIKKLVQEIDPTIQHEHSPEYSNLLYGGSTEYFITPKSNIIAGNYDSADSKELIKWSDLRNNLKAIFNADYYINSENKLIIEHVSYFYNGLSLSGRRIGFDLTTLKCLETNRSWSFGANKYTYENDKIPQRFTFSFMDKTSVIFDGNPIDINNKFVADGVNEDYTASIITTDVDFIQSAPQDVNKDGFCLLAASGGVVQIATINLGVNKIYEIQNGQLAFTNLHEKYWLDNMPASSIKINQVTKTAKTVKRTKLQPIEFPLSSEIDIDGLIKTQIGIGKIKSHKFNISTLKNELNINHDIE